MDTSHNGSIFIQFIREAEIYSCGVGVIPEVRKM